MVETQSIMGSPIRDRIEELVEVGKIADKAEQMTRRVPMWGLM